MSNMKLVKRLAGRIAGRGMGSIRIKPSAMDDAKNALTSEDVRALVKGGKVYALPEKHNLSLSGKALRARRKKGRSRGIGKRRGTAKARGGIDHKKRMRSQRRVLSALKEEKLITNEQFKTLYALVRGGTFLSKGALISRAKSAGVQISDEKSEKLRHI